ncbi:hypothetical protein ACFO4O_09935 [Glaciecola siphonariae]|uniref:Chemotaxis protein n=1 Tax=Glaciecola siphonariae TaxID=521012 RepID=A0ABV9LXZ4_9ALTE
MRKTFTALGLAAALILLLFILLFDLSPSVDVASSKQVDKADSVNALLEQITVVVRERNAPHQLSVKLEQAHSLAGFLQRAHAQAKADVAFEQNKALLQLSYQFTTFVTNLYLNLEVQVLNGKGVNLAYVKIGSISIPGGLALKLTQWLANTYTDSEVATEAIALVKEVDITPQRALLDLAPSATFFLALKSIRTGEDDPRTVLLKRQLVHYLRFLDALEQAPLNAANHSLSAYLHPLMQEAQRLSISSDAVLQNEAALLALAIYAGNYRFSRMVGQLDIEVADIPTSKRAPVLAARQDLSLHFLYSAAIKLLSEQDISIAVGEFKELMDRGAGGSGYSFADLAADLSGAHLAALAVNPQYASHVQSVLSANASEQAFFPSVDGLDEGLNAQAFASKYQAVDSVAYQQAVDVINQRIGELDVSNLSP